MFRAILQLFVIQIPNIVIIIVGIILEGRQFAKMRASFDAFDKDWESRQKAHEAAHGAAPH